jgi:hypothetical protein
MYSLFFFIQHKGGDRLKKLVPAVLILILLFGFLDYKYTQNKYKDITYTVERHMTSGIFNRHKLLSVNSLTLTFSDSTMAVVIVNGMLKKTPHQQVSFKAFVEKKKNGTWKVSRIYPNE